MAGILFKVDQRRRQFLGWAALAGLIALMPPDPGTSALNASLDAVTAAAAIFSGIFCGMLPAVRASRASLQSAFKDQGANATGGAGSVRLRKSLIVAQVAMTAALLVAAALFGESLIRTERVNLGMRINQIMQFDFSPGLIFSRAKRGFVQSTARKTGRSAGRQCRHRERSKATGRGDGNRYGQLRRLPFVEGRGHK